MKFNLEGLSDPTYNEPLINVEIRGTEVRIDTKRANGYFIDIVSLEVSNLKIAIIKNSIARYQQGIDNGSKVYAQYLACDQRRLDIYERIYIPYLMSRKLPTEVVEAQVKPVVIHPPVEPVSLGSHGQFSMF